jgi:hypothetical protein
MSGKNISMKVNSTFNLFHPTKNITYSVKLQNGQRNRQVCVLNVVRSGKQFLQVWKNWSASRSSRQCFTPLNNHFCKEYSLLQFFHFAEMFQVNTSQHSSVLLVRNDAEFKNKLMGVMVCF